MITCLDCQRQPPYCDRCVSATVAFLRGTAGSRGWGWAERVAAKVRDSRPWPPFEGKARTIALRLVAGLNRDERVNEQLAEICHADAARRYATVIAARGH